jgi:hypothetical protein
MNSVSEDRAGTASGINNAVSRLAGVLSIAAFGLVMLAGFDRQMSSHMGAIHLKPEIRREIETQRVKLTAIEIPPGIDNGLRGKIRQSIDESFVTGFRLVIFVSSALALLSALTAWLMIERKPKQ